MNVLLLGSGGREHAIAWKLSQSSLLRSLHLASGNGGTSDLGVSANLNLLDFPSIERYIRKHDIELVVVGPEAPLVAGISDYLEESTKINVKVVGPRKAGAMIEGSKEFAKKFMARHNIPTAEYKVFRRRQSDSGSPGQMEDYLRGEQYIDEQWPVVVKASGLAGGKGAIVPRDKEEAKEALRNTNAVHDFVPFKTTL